VSAVHPTCRPPRSARVVAAFDLGSWGDVDDGNPHHAFICADPKSEDNTHGIAFVAKCTCKPGHPSCPRMQIMRASRMFYDSVTIVEMAPKSQERSGRRR
jgi:hypothetical protein